MSSSTAQPSCSSYMARTVFDVSTAFCGSYAQVLQMLPPPRHRPNTATWLATVARLAIRADPDGSPGPRLNFSRCAVVGKGDHHLAAGAQELPVQFFDRFGESSTTSGTYGPALI